ncbi:MAG: hypothetical protein MUO23_11860 [Anaerolineales bacterium]|nr:hypothetical protein [Anaerolineales bacterium]
MRSWQWSADDGYTLILAADVRFGRTDYVEDQIWEVLACGREPAGLTAATRYGGQVQGMRIFPSFALEGRAAVDPMAFHLPVVVCQALPNYARLAFWPLPEIEASAEYWVTDSHRLVSRIALTARSERRLQVDLRLHVVLLPGQDADPMRPVTRAGVAALQGRVGGLQPVVFLSGGAVPFRSIYPSLQVSASLAPGESRSWAWAHAGWTDAVQGFEAARSAAGLPLDALAARIERMAEGIVQVETGNPGWDGALHLSQVAALSSFIGPTRHLPAASPVLRRAPEDGHSPLGDGTDHDWRWNGQEMISACYIARQVLPAAPDLAKGVVLNALATQGADGAVDGKPGLAGQRLRMAGAPMLGELCWQIYQQTEDLDFITQVLPRLLESFESWFEVGRDRDQDGFPEWDHPLQPGYETHPVFSLTDPSCQGMDLSWAESPDLAAFLLSEADALRRLAEAAGQAKSLAAIEARRRRLLEGLGRCWDPESGSYRRIDRSLHTIPSPGELVRAAGDGRHEPKVTLRPPSRLVVRVSGPVTEARNLEIGLSGYPAGGREHTLRLEAADFSWSWETGCATTAETFARLWRVHIRGLGEGFEITVQVPDLGRLDIGTLLPLSSKGAPPEEAAALLEGQLLRPEQFWRPYGLPFLPASDAAYRDQLQAGTGGVLMPWNSLLGTALLACGRGMEAATHFERLMAGIVGCLRHERAFFQSYHPETGEGLGDRHAACGAAPLSLLLACVGVQLISPTRVGLRGRNVLAGPVKVRWRGLEVTRTGEVSRVVFPDGQTVEVQGQEPLVIEQQPRQPAGKVFA